MFVYLLANFLYVAANNPHFCLTKSDENKTSALLEFPSRHLRFVTVCLSLPFCENNVCAI